MIEKLNNKDFIYKNIRLFYIYSNDKVCKDVIKNCINEIILDLYLNISIKDLKKLIKYRKQRNLINNKDVTNYSIYQKIKNLTNKYINNFLYYYENFLENIIFFH